MTGEAEFVCWKEEFALGVDRVDADMHFAGEEQALAETGCPCLPLQQRQHAMFRRNLRNIAESTVRSRAMLDFMRDWLVLHILETDRRCVPWLGRSAALAAGSASRSAP